MTFGFTRYSQHYSYNNQSHTIHDSTVLNRTNPDTYWRMHMIHVGIHISSHVSVLFI